MNKKIIRQIRLQNDLEEITRFSESCPCISSFDILKEENGFPTEYRLHFKIRTYTDGGKPVQKCSVKLFLPENYPFVAPYAVMDSPVIFHPHWFDYGRWCFGDAWRNDESIVQFITNMIKSIQFDDADTINPLSLANLKAYEWYKANKGKGKFPADNTPLSRVIIKKRYK